MNSKVGSILWFEDRIHTIEYYIDSFRDLNVDNLIVVSGNIVRNISLDRSLAFMDCVGRSQPNKIDSSDNINSVIDASNEQTVHIHCSVVSIDSPFLMQALSAGFPVFVLLDPYLNLSIKEPVNTLKLSELIKVRTLGPEVRFLYSDSNDSFTHDELLANRALRLPLAFDWASSGQLLERCQDYSDVLIVSNDERFDETAASNRKLLVSICEKYNVCYHVVGTNTIPITGVNSELSYKSRETRLDMVRGAQLVISAGGEPLNNIDVWLHDALAVGTPILTCKEYHSTSVTVQNNYQSRSLKVAQRALIDLSRDDLDLTAFKDQEVFYSASYLEHRNGADADVNLLIKYAGEEKNKSDGEAVRIGIVCPSHTGSTEYILAKQLCILLQKDISSRSPNLNIELVLFVEDTDKNVESDDSSGLCHRTFKWTTITKVDAIAAYRFIGLNDVTSGERLICIDDQIKNGADCALLVVVSDLLPGRMLRVAPTVFISTGKSRASRFARSFEGQSLKKLALEENFDQSDRSIVLTSLSYGSWIGNQDSQGLPNPFDFMSGAELEHRPKNRRGESTDYILLFFENLPLDNLKRLVKELCELIFEVENMDSFDVVLGSISRESFFQLVNDVYDSDQEFVASRIALCRRIRFIDSIGLVERTQLIAECSIYVHLQTEFEALASVKVAECNRSRVLIVDSKHNRVLLKNNKLSIPQILFTSKGYSSLRKDIKKMLLCIDEAEDEIQEHDVPYTDYSKALYLPIVEKWI